MTSSADGGPARWRDVLTRQYGPALVLVCMGVWLHAAESLLIATMMPAMIAEIGGAELVAWTIALYEIGTIVAGATGALLAIRFGVRLPMGIAATVFAVGSAVAALAPSMWVVLAGRLLQGLGGGGLMALSFIAASLLFPKRLIARVVAAISTLWGVSAFFGPLVGGFFVEFATWRAGFWFFALQALALALWIAVGAKLRQTPARGGVGQRPPIVRLVFLATGVVLIAYGGIDIALVRTTAFILAGVACLAIFVRLDDARGENRLLPRRPYSLRAPASAALVMILCFAGDPCLWAAVDDPAARRVRPAGGLCRRH